VAWLVQEVIEVDGLVRAMKTTNANVHNTLLDAMAIVGWHFDAGRNKPQVGLIQFDWTGSSTPHGFDASAGVSSSNFRHLH
jgi:hypothetical protein